MSPVNQALIMESREQMNILFKRVKKANAWSKKSGWIFLRLIFLALAG